MCFRSVCCSLSDSSAPDQRAAPAIAVTPSDLRVGCWSYADPRLALSNRLPKLHVFDSASTFAAQMKSFSDKPLIAWVVNFMRHTP